MLIFMFYQSKLIVKKYDIFRFLIYTFVTSATIWAGFRDLRQLIEIFKSVTGFAVGSVKESSGLFSDYTPLVGGQLESPMFYFLIVKRQAPGNPPVPPDDNFKFYIYFILIPWIFKNIYYAFGLIRIPFFFRTLVEMG